MSVGDSDSSPGGSNLSHFFFFFFLFCKWEVFCSRKIHYLASDVGVVLSTMMRNYRSFNLQRAASFGAQEELAGC